MSQFHLMTHYAISDANFSSRQLIALVLTTISYIVVLATPLTFYSIFININITLLIFFF